ncbi:1,2-phenylacetyl-CoA epoxidase subunit PaaD [Fulvivirga sedimenti]|uniref:Phenylacetate-CoA oxygenase subunit PaaJ n=1 Tax=Fulvivirga sedimenti TaxID=2879465 RepID=A0A9X1HQ99_9BACT|nr:1,2-phenylacetyl-CoA epoxidase subunit PaaD [Fulvivirga sedimenti]MCA6075235.1 phenylacetate-CoA oxygenase subunit PaaJ [Fulvivirga sedimenti]MCA6076412.1 phenylacetate-CoA oxygenase subunit PaaJ [Fulvivirga sedimenti]MCA6077540.1 phenylacetate-CoA oxygenase subunit PaaJ [Fulvivirga sedimenti]
MGKISDDQIYDWLQDVKDPEIPVISLVDLGVITRLDWQEEHLTVHMTPTFVGCPAIDYMKQDVIDVLHQHGLQEVDVKITYETSWNSNMISDQGREALRKFGLAPPPKHNLIVDIDVLEHATCPVCGSENTQLKNPFGPTACRSIHYCENCKETFEQFKPV